MKPYQFDGSEKDAFETIKSRLAQGIEKLESARAEITETSVKAAAALHNAIKIETEGDIFDITNVSKAGDYRRQAELIQGKVAEKSAELAELERTFVQRVRGAMQSLAAKFGPIVKYYSGEVAAGLEPYYFDFGRARNAAGATDFIVGFSSWAQFSESGVSMSPDGAIAAARRLISAIDTTLKTGLPQSFGCPAGTFGAPDAAAQTAETVSA